MDDKANVLKSRIVRTVINSDRRADLDKKQLDFALVLDEGNPNLSLAEKKKLKKRGKQFTKKDKER